MAIEIEMKAWIDDWQATCQRADTICHYQRDVRKDDVYYRLGSGATAREFRIRSEDGATRCTFKESRSTAAVEINREVEFTVADGERFTEFVEMLGCLRYIVKSKQGRLYRYGELTVELVKVEGLGYFAEIEQVVADEAVARDPQLCERIAAEIRATLSLLGIASERIERRRYIEMLAAQ